MKYMKNVAIITVYLVFAILYSCEPVIETEYVEVKVEKEIIVTEIVVEEIEVLRDVERFTEIEVIKEIEVVRDKIEYVDREVIIEVPVEVEIEKEIIITKYVEVDNIIEVITEVEVETIVETEKIVEVEIEKIVTVDNYITETEYVEIEKVITNDIIVDNIVNTETIVYLTKEIYVVEEPEIVVDPIKEYDNYITTGSKVLGVTEEGFEEIPLIQGLFKLDGVIYFTIDSVGYSQTGGTVIEIEESDFPEVPASECIEFSSGNYSVQKAVYGEEDISKVYRGTSNQARYIIDGACIRGSDLIFSCPVDTGNLLKGVWIWPVNGSQSIQMGDGRIW